MDDFERIYAEHFDIVYGYCLKLTHDPHLAEEVTQEAFFKALKACLLYTSWACWRWWRWCLPPC